MNVLLIRLRVVGDVVFTTPAIRAVRRALPEARLTYLVEPAASAVVAHNPHLDEVMVRAAPHGPARLLADWQLGAELRQRRFDVVADFHGGPRASWLTLASRAPRRIGYGVSGRSWMYTDVVGRPRELRPRHSVENQWDVLRPLLPGLEPADPARDPVEMPEDPDAARRIAAWLDRQGIGPLHVPIVIHVSAGNPFRRWPLDGFAELAAHLSSSDTERRIILTSGPSEAEAAEEVVRRALRLTPAQGGTIVTCGGATLAELRSLIGRAALYIGGDSGPLHIAAATPVPIVALYGPTLPARSAPWRDPAFVTEAVETEDLPCRPCEQRICQPGDFRCLTRISATRVVETAERALARARTSAAGTFRGNNEPKD
ncbi:MAG: glycosyltransferase family 9 protein [Vicinamibacteraceae bacterium]